MRPLGSFEDKWGSSRRIEGKSRGFEHRVGVVAELVASRNA